MDGTLRPWPAQLPVHDTPFSSPVPTLTWSGGHTPTIEQNFHVYLDDARNFLNAVSHVKAPDDLRLVQSGRNRLAGMLRLFAHSFRESRWELMQEGAQRLERAVQILREGEAL